MDAFLSGGGMGEFFRFAGERLMLLIVLALIGAFLCETGKMRPETARRLGRVLLCVWGAEAAHVLLSGLMYFTVYGSEGFPALEEMFRTAYLEKMYGALQMPAFFAPVSGALAWLGHGIGKVLFGQYALGGVLFSEGITYTACCLLDARLRERFSSQAALQGVLLACLLPGAVFLYLPGWPPLLFLGAAWLFFALGKRLPQKEGKALPGWEYVLLLAGILTAAVDYALISGRI